MEDKEPGPAEAARRALRAARAGRVTGQETAEDAPSGPADADGGGSVTAGGADSGRAADEPADTHSDLAEHQRPADLARAALREAVAARRGTRTEPRDEDPEPTRGGPVPGGSPEPTRGGPVPGGSPEPATGAPVTAERRDEETRSPSSATGTAAPPTPPGVRPADRAREALRAARAQARSAESDTADKSPGRPARGRRAEPPTGRPAGPQAERVREVRRFLADAFRMPAAAEDPDEPAAAPAPAGAAKSPAPAREDERPTAHAPAGVSVPAAPRAPVTMAAPTRDGDHRRTFPRFPPRTRPGTATTGTTAATTPADDGETSPAFAETWWGNAWVDALERGALDAARLARGRVCAEQGTVDAITVTPGLVLAYVQGSRPRPYRVQVRLRTLGDDDWARFLDAAADRPGHIAALLDKEMPHSLTECGIPLLPGPGDLEPHCSCPDRGHPCKHAAALCYQTARLLDADPFVLLLLRGRGEREVLDALSRLSATRAARAAQERAPDPLPGVRATDALAPRRLPPLPPPLPLPAHPEQPPVYPDVPDGPDALALDQLATDAAARAHTLLTTGHDKSGELTLWQDAVRLAAARPGSGLTAGSRALYASLAAAAGRTPAELARAVAAWRQGGTEGLAALEEPWDPPAGRFDRARPLLLAADLPAFRPWRNRLTHPLGHVQLRLGRDGLWYAYEADPGSDDWWPRGTPDPDPVGALTGLGALDAYPQD
ncbi:SWIM zinc finger family protein [Streptomyces sp. NPDC006186]|uniref:SWIM zinc finger family protein n=1 Tax=Streptomyces sp. NPDC006186 TaxID=3155248 RepID=UPI0033B3F9D7